MLKQVRTCFVYKLVGVVHVAGFEGFEEFEELQGFRITGLQDYRVTGLQAAEPKRRIIEFVV